jgi:hypothetical protein
MSGVIIGAALLSLVVFFVVNGFYLSKDVDADPYHPFDADADRPDETGRRKPDEKP